MTIRTNPIRRIDGLVLEDFEAPLADFLAARAEENFVRNPVPSAARQRRLDRLEGEREDTQGILGVSAGEITRQARELQGERVPEPAPSPLLTPLEAAERAEGLPLTFDRPIRASVVEELVRRKRAELRRQSVMSRRSGFGSQLLGFGLDLITTAADPLNIASAFIPVVGPARFASMVARSGVRSARFTRGAIEGAVGAAVVEPIVLRTAINEQADYDFLDSLLNLALGSILGGGLHVAGGFVSDRLAAAAGRPTVSERLAALSPETRETAARVALAQTLEGRQVDVEPVVRRGEALAAEETARSSQADAPPPTSRTPAPETAPGDPPLPADDAIEPAGSPFRETRSHVIAGETVELVFPDGLHARLFDHALAVRRTEQGGRAPPAGEARQLFNAFRPFVLEDFRDPGDVADLALDFLDVIEEAGATGVRFRGERTMDAGDVIDADLRTAFFQARARQLDAIQRRAPTGEDLSGFAARQGDPEQLSLPDFEASRRAERDVAGLSERLDPDAARAELADAEQLLDEVADALEIPRERLREDLAEADDAIEEAEALARAVRAAAICQTRI